MLVGALVMHFGQLWIEVRNERQPADRSQALVPAQRANREHGKRHTDDDRVLVVWRFLCPPIVVTRAELEHARANPLRLYDRLMSAVTASAGTTE